MANLTATEMADFTFGVGVCEVSVIFIAIGANLQRYALDRIDPSLRVCHFLSTRTVAWLGALGVYFFANVLYTIALVYAPASLCATLFATIVPVNAVTSRLILGEVLHLVDIEGGLLIFIGIGFAAHAAPQSTATYDADQLHSLLLAPRSLLLLGGIALVALALAVMVTLHEAGCCMSLPTPRFGRRTAQLTGLMPFAYPLVIGLLESLVQIAQKSGESLRARPTSPRCCQLLHPHLQAHAHRL